MSKASIFTLGCRVNQYESDAIEERLVNEGFEIVPFGEKCDVVIINTCTVTAESDRKSRQHIRRAHSFSPDAAIIVTGCFAHVAPDQVKAIEGVSAVANNKDKGVCLFVIGKNSIDKGMRIIGSHIDSPRIDLKANPLYQEANLGLFKTHYYGGIKKYQWVSLPLALHGVVILKDGSKEDICDSIWGILYYGYYHSRCVECTCNLYTGKIGNACDNCFGRHILYDSIAEIRSVNTGRNSRIPKRNENISTFKKGQTCIIFDNRTYTV